MKSKINLILIVASAGLVSACNQNNPPPTPKETQAAVQDAWDKGRDEFLATVDKKLAELDAKIDKLSAKADAASGDAKARYEQTVSDLRAQRDAIRKQYDQMKLKQDSQEAWDKTKAAFQTGWDNLEHAYDVAAAKITGNPPPPSNQ